MSITLRREIPKLASIVIFAVMVLSTLFVDFPALNALGLEFTKWSNVISSMSVGLGVVSLCLYHIPRMIKRDKENPYQWIYSISSLFFMFAFIFVGFAYGLTSKAYSWWYDTFNAPIAAAAPFLSGFFMVPATYKAFKLKNLDAASLMIPAILFMIYQTPMFSGVPVLSTICIYLLAYVTSATFRAAIIIVGLGIIYLSIRTILGMEKGYLPEGG